MSRAELIDAFAGFPDRLAAAVQAAAADRRAVSPDEWGPAEVVRHLIAVEGEVWQSRLAHVAADDDPHWTWTEPGLAPGFGGVPVVEVVAAFAAARAATVTTIRVLDGVGWARHGTHAAYGVLDIEGLLRIAIDHDASHLEGLEGPHGA